MTGAARSGKSSDFVLNFGGGFIYFCGSLVSVLDLVIIQRTAYHLDSASITGFVLLKAGLGLRIQATRTLGKYCCFAGFLQNKYSKAWVLP